MPTGFSQVSVANAENAQTWPSYRQKWSFQSLTRYSLTLCLNWPLKLGQLDECASVFHGAGHVGCGKVQTSLMGTRHLALSLCSSQACSTALYYLFGELSHKQAGPLTHAVITKQPEIIGEWLQSFVFPPGLSRLPEQGT